jgi:hypothetical protein
LRGRAMTDAVRALTLAAQGEHEVACELRARVRSAAGVSRFIDPYLKRLPGVRDRRGETGDP